MKYYEIHDPYYALIQAKSEQEAENIYIENVAGDEDDRGKLEIKEVIKDYAFRTFYKACERESKTREKVLVDFDNPLNEVLLIDGDLI